MTLVGVQFDCTSLLPPFVQNYAGQISSCILDSLIPFFVYYWNHVFQIAAAA